MDKSEEIVVVNPATEREIGRVAVRSAGEVREAVARAAAAQRDWAKVPIKRRCAEIRRFSEAVARHAREIADLTVAESGKPYEEALIHELMATVGIIS